MRLRIKIARVAWAIAVSLILIGQYSYAAAPSKEYKVKAGFIYNFTKFVEWPGDLQDVNICILGSDMFAGALKAIEKKSTSQRKYRVYRNPISVDGCAIVYTEQANTARVKPYVKALHDKAVLVVFAGEVAPIEQAIVSFVKKNNKLRLVINQRRAEHVGLRIDPQLLEVALRVIK